MLVAGLVRLFARLMRSSKCLGCCCGVSTGLIIILTG